MFAGVSNIEIGDKKVANIYLGQDPVPVYTSGEPVPDYNWQARFNLSYDGATNDTIQGWNTLRPVLVDGKIPVNTSFTDFVDQDGNPLAGVALTMTQGTNFYALDGTGPSTPDSKLYNQKWRYATPNPRLQITGLDESKRYTVQVLVSDDDASIPLSETSILLQTQGNVSFDVLTRGVTMDVPATLSFEDDNWLRFDGASRSHGMINLLLQKRGTGSVTTIQAIIITEYNKTVNGVQTLHTAGNTDSPLPYVSYEPEGTGSKPAFIFLHGSGERGNGSANALNNAMKFGPNRQVIDGIFNQDAYAFTPQINTDTYWPYEYETLGDFVDYVLGEHDIDPLRLYIIGFSDGALGVGSLITHLNATKLAAYVTMAYDPIYYIGIDTDPILMDNNIVAEVPGWVFKNRYDTSGSPVNNVIGGVGVINGINPNICKLTVFNDYTHEHVAKILNGTGHNAMVDSEYDEFSQDIYEWLLGHSL